MRHAIFLLFAVVMAHCSAASARSWYVKPDGSGDVPAIKVAVDSAAAQGDTILLANGTFTGAENRGVDCLDKALTIISESGDPGLCVIDCGHAGPGDDLTALYFRVSEHGVPRLEGVTIAGACGGVICDTSSCPVIANCVFRDNHCYGAEIGPPGGGLRCDTNSSPLVINCTFLRNGGDAGGGIYCHNSSANIVNTSFLENWAGLGGGVGIDGGAPKLTNCLFSGNAGGNPFNATGGGGMWCGGSAELVNCTFQDNVCYGPGGGLYFEPGSDSDLLALIGCTFINNRVDRSNHVPRGGAIAVGYMFQGHRSNLTIANCTFWSNRADDSYRDGSALSIEGPSNVNLESTLIAFGGDGAAICCYMSDTPTLKCCDIYGNADGDWVGCIAGQGGVNGNVSADPKFCDTRSGYFMVEDCSPCLPSHHPDGYDCGIIGAFGSGCECDAATEPTTWGAIKAMYK